MWSSTLQQNKYVFMYTVSTKKVASLILAITSKSACSQLSLLLIFGHVDVEITQKNDLK